MEVLPDLNVEARSYEPRGGCHEWAPHGTVKTHRPVARTLRYHIIVDEESSLIDRGANGVKLSAVIDSYGARERVA
jgi:hypothetical protein